MLKVAVLDDYQNVFHQLINTKEYEKKYKFISFNKAFQTESETIEVLKDFEVLFLMRERTKISKTLIESRLAV